MNETIDDIFDIPAIYEHVVHLPRKKYLWRICNRKWPDILMMALVYATFSV